MPYCWHWRNKKRIQYLELKRHEQRQFANRKYYNASQIKGFNLKRNTASVVEFHRQRKLSSRGGNYKHYSLVLRDTA